MCGARAASSERGVGDGEAAAALRARGALAAYWSCYATRAAAPLCLRVFYAPGACVAPPRSRMKGRNITSICNSLRQIDINGDGFNKV